MIVLPSWASIAVFFRNACYLVLSRGRQSIRKRMLRSLCRGLMSSMSTVDEISRLDTVGGDKIPVHAGAVERKPAVDGPVGE